MMAGCSQKQIIPYFKMQLCLILFMALGAFKKKNTPALTALSQNQRLFVSPDHHVLVMVLLSQGIFWKKGRNASINQRGGFTSCPPPHPPTHTHKSRIDVYIKMLFFFKFIKS